MILMSCPLHTHRAARSRRAGRGAGTGGSGRRAGHIILGARRLLGFFFSIPRRPAVVAMCALMLLLILVRMLPCLFSPTVALDRELRLVSNCVRVDVIDRTY